MKILYVVPALGPVYGGPSKSVIELADSVGSQGHLIDLITTNANGAKNLPVPLQQWEQEKNYRKLYFSRWKIAKEYKVSNALTLWLNKNIKHYDVVHAQSLFCYPTLLACLLCRVNDIPYVISPRGMLEPWSLAHKGVKKRIYYSFIERPMLQGANAIHFLASSEKENAEKMDLKAPLITLPNGIHKESFDKQYNTENFYQTFPHLRNKTIMLFLGRIDPKKGLDLLAPAFARLQRQFPLLHLVIAGPDNTGFLPTAQSYFASEGCQNSVTFTGMLTGDLKYSALAAAKLYVAPSYSEGFSMSVLEGMASSLPCVITTGCNFPEAGQAGVAHVVDLTTEAIAEAILTCLQDPIGAKAMGERARQFIFENYTWDKIAAKLVRVYQAIMEHKPLPTFVDNAISMSEG